MHRINLHHSQVADTRGGAHVFAHSGHRGAALVEDSEKGVGPKENRGAAFVEASDKGVGPKENFTFVHEKTPERGVCCAAHNY